MKHNDLLPRIEMTRRAILYLASQIGANTDVKLNTFQNLCICAEQPTEIVTRYNRWQGLLGICAEQPTEIITSYYRWQGLLGIDMFVYQTLLRGPPWQQWNRLPSPPAGVLLQCPASPVQTAD